MSEFWLNKPEWKQFALINGTYYMYIVISTLRLDLHIYSVNSVLFEEEK